jgi:hypothetical protein
MSCRVNVYSLSGGGSIGTLPGVVPAVEVDTQSAGFYVLIFTLHHAYPRVEKGEGHQERTWYAHRRTCKHEKQHIAPSTFRLQSGLAGTRDATDAAPPEPPETRGRRTRAAWWSPPTCGAATVAFERRLAAPDRLAATGTAAAAAKRAQTRTVLSGDPPRARPRPRPRLRW